MQLRRYSHLLSRYLLPQWRLLSALVLLLLTTIGLELANPLILRSFIDTARGGGSTRTLTAIAMLFLGVAIVTQIVAVAEAYVAENVGWRATNRIRSDLAAHCLRLDPAFLNAYTPGELIERIDGDVQTLSNFFSRFVVYVLGNGVLLAGVLVMLWRIDPRVGGAMSLFALLALVIINRFRDVASPHWNAARQASAEIIGFIEERLAATEDIRSSGATAYALRRLHEQSRNLLQKTRHASLMGSAMAWVTILLFTIGTAISLGLGAYLFLGGLITLGTVYLIFSYGQMLNRPIDEITRQLSDLQQALASVGRVQAIFDTRSAITDGPGEPIPVGPLRVEFDCVTFAYPGGEPVLRDISFTVSPGEVLGVLGRTGSGKTTLSRLLFRLYDPDCGEVRLGGVDLRSALVGDVRRSVGIVTQDIQLFHATVRDNLTFFDASIPDDRISAVLQDLGLWEWCRELPQGLDTVLTSGGSGLSAGEAQLLAFARVFLKDPGLVILDEASSRLDPATEHLIERAVDRLLEGRTGIIIAHRLGTIRRADHVLVLGGGKVEEYGPRDDLLHDSRSHFSRLMQAGLEEVLV